MFSTSVEKPKNSYATGEFAVPNYPVAMRCLKWVAKKGAHISIECMLQG